MLANLTDSTLFSQIPLQHHHQMTVAEANEFFLDFDQQQTQQEPVANVLQVLYTRSSTPIIGLQFQVFFPAKQIDTTLYTSLSNKYDPDLNTRIYLEQQPSQSMLPIVAGDEQLAQETVAQILSQATATAATHIMLPLPPPPPPGQSQVGFFSISLFLRGNQFLHAF